MIGDRIKKSLEMNDEKIDILKGEASKQINQVKESITKFLDKEKGTLAERIDSYNFEAYIWIL